jgi:hypothetical protein
MQPFDFSSKLAWENYYASLSTNQVSDGAFSKSDDILEWHSSIPLSTISEYVLQSARPTPSAAGVTPNPRWFRCLLLGCGTSDLPRVLVRQFRNLLSTCDRNVNMELTLLDSSPSCLAQMRQRFDNDEQDDRVFLNYVCADVTNYQEYVWACRNRDRTEESNCPRTMLYDVIVDKGLLDALLCNEGWEPGVTTLLRASCDLLVKNASNRRVELLGLDSLQDDCSAEALFVPAADDDKQIFSLGRYLLISYGLPKSTREFLETATAESHLSWTFDMPESNSRVQVSQATFNETALEV